MNDWGEGIELKNSKTIQQNDLVIFVQTMQYLHQHLDYGSINIKSSSSPSMPILSSKAEVISLFNYEEMISYADALDYRNLKDKFSNIT